MSNEQKQIINDLIKNRVQFIKDLSDTYHENVRYFYHIYSHRGFSHDQIIPLLFKHSLCTQSAIGLPAHIKELRNKNNNSWNFYEY